MIQSFFNGIFKKEQKKTKEEVIIQTEINEEYLKHDQVREEFKDYLVDYITADVDYKLQKDLQNKILKIEDTIEHLKNEFMAITFNISNLTIKISEVEKILKTYNLQPYNDSEKKNKYLKSVQKKSNL